MAQPANLPRWADTVSADTTRVRQPPSGKQDVGWARQERPPNQHINWLLYTIYLWCNYLKNLAGEALTWTAAHVFSSTVTVAGNTSLTTVSTSGAATLASAGVAGNATVGGTLGVTGQATFNAQVNLAAGASISGSGTSDATLRNVNCTAVAASGNVVASDLRFTASRTKWVYIAANQANNGNWVRFGGAAGAMKYTGPGNESMSVALEVESGERIVSVTLRWTNTDATLDAHASVVEDADNAVVVPGAGTTLAHNNAAVQTTVIAVNTNMGTNAWSVFLSTDLGIASGAFNLFAVGVTVTRP